ncbi:MAG: DapH/DapD/GlmU-related protein [Bacteroidales bacterium]|nr:DapH/DapD/GlmU-related protein [Bacteroidales bacterium]
MDKIYFFYSIERWLYRHHLTPLAILVRAFIRIIFSADVPYQLEIGKGTKHPHDALGSLYHPHAKIGRNCIIRHGITIGGRSGYKKLLQIGDNVDIGAHAMILGPITIGNNAFIGAGAIVINDVPPYAVVAGNPARIIRINNPESI